MRPAWLTSDRYHLRPLVADDAAEVARWFPGPFPVGPAAAGSWLEEQHRWSPWDDPGRVILAIIEHGSTDDDEEIVGSVQVTQLRARASDLSIRVAPALSPDAEDRIGAAALALVVPWLMGELEALAVTVAIAADRPATRAAADRCGMILTTRLRQHVARPGGRVDVLWYQALRPEAPVIGPEASLPADVADGRDDA